MGQKISALRRKNHAFKEDAQCDSEIEDSPLRVTSSEDECAGLSSRIIEDDQSSIIRTSSEIPHPIQESDIDTISKGLLKLPTELILEIAEYLPPSGYMSLSYSCRRIRNGMGACIEHVLGDRTPIGRHSTAALSVETRNIRSLERMEWRRMLDRDNDIPSPKAYCSRCCRTHDRSLFSIQSLTQPSTERCCLGSAGRFWLCPHRNFDYDQATNSSTETSNGSLCGGRHVSMYGETHSSCSYGRVGKTASFLTSWPIMKMPQAGLPSNQEVEEALRPLKAPICPHLRLNDACVAKAYLGSCGRPQRGLAFGRGSRCRCLICHSDSRIACRFCNIRIQFIIRTRYYGPDTLGLTTARSLWYPSSCTDREWIRQVADPADLEEYEEAWYAASAECGRKVGSGR